SAGVRVVLNPPITDPVIMLESGPELRIDGAGPTPLFRVEAGILSPNGTILIANSGYHEILEISSTGALVRRVGREGDGPGEFRSIRWLHAAPDGGYIVGDVRLRRATAFDSTGVVRWSTVFDPAPAEPPRPDAIIGNGLLVSALPDGRLLGFPRVVALPGGGGDPLPVRGDLRVYTPDLTEHVDLGNVTNIVWLEDPGAEGIPVASLLEAPRLHFDAHLSRHAYTEGAGFRVDVIDHGARTIVMAEDRSRLPFEPDSIPAMYARAADSPPSYRDLRIDSEHRVWVRASRDADPAEWRVFDASGVGLAVVLLPADARPLDAEGSRLLLLRRDELHVESIELWRIRWGAE